MIYVQFLGSFNIFIFQMTDINDCDPNPCDVTMAGLALMSSIAIVVYALMGTPGKTVRQV